MTRKQKKLRSTLAANIRARAERNGIGLNRLADFAGVSRSMLFDVLACNQAPTVDWIEKVASVFDVEPHTLLQKAAA